MYLGVLKDWAPFRIDALGLVTLLGVDELNIAVGRLVRNRYTEYLPLLGGYIIAQNAITKPIPGFVIYNISDGIKATDITGWFSRWLMSHDLTWTSTTLDISGAHEKKSSILGEAGTLIIGIFMLLPILAFAATKGDWWGFSNSVSVLISIVVRRVIIGENRRALDSATEQALVKSANIAKTFCTLPDGHTVTIRLPRGILLDCLLTTPHPPKPKALQFDKDRWSNFGCFSSIPVLSPRVLLNALCLFGRLHRSIV